MDAEGFADEKRLNRQRVVTAVALGVLLFAGLVCAAGASRNYPATAALLWALACLIVGAIAGFLFAIPRVPAVGDSGAKDRNALHGTGEKRSGLGINTNLEQVSDWLTKILVGLGLVEAKTLLQKLRAAGSIIGSAFGPNGAAVATGMIVFFLGLGFISGFILTRIFLSPMFLLADRETEGTSQLDETTRIAKDAEAQSKSMPELYDAMDAAYAALMDSRNAKKRLPADVASALLAELQKFQANPRWNLNRRLHMLLGVFSRRTDNLEQGIDILLEFVKRKQKAGQIDIHQAAALYNIACYKAVEAHNARTQGDAPKAEAKDLEALQFLEKSVKITPSNGPEAQGDEDFKDLWGDDRFIALTVPPSS